jgi:hypothetical protein
MASRAGVATTWTDRTLVALANLPTDPPPSDDALVEEVAVLFADRFESADRSYAATGDRPRWHGHVRAALEEAAVRRTGGARRQASNDRRRETARHRGPSGGRAGQARSGVRGRGRRARAAAARARRDRRPAARPAGPREDRLHGRGGRAHPGDGRGQPAFRRWRGRRVRPAHHLWQRVSGGRRPRCVAVRYGTRELSVREVERSSRPTRSRWRRPGGASTGCGPTSRYSCTSTGRA